jgi:class 3 adenylate cyclase
MIDVSEGIYTDITFAVHQEERARKLLHICLWVVAILSAVWAVVISTSMKGDAVAIAIAFNLGVSAAAFGALYFARRVAFRALAHWTFWVNFAYIWFGQLRVEGLSHFESASANLWFLVASVAITLILFREDRRVLGAYVVLAFVSLSVCSFRFIESMPVVKLDPAELTITRGVTYLSVFVTTILLTLAWDREVRDAERNLATVNKRMEDLIANMLPRSISDRLRREGRTFADGISECSVMFADIVGFTKVSADMQPSEVVKLLDEIFSHFDELTAHAGLEKIKTIGDSYMVAAGIPEPRVDHAQSLVRLAMEMQAVIRRYGLHLRCGINSGNVVAGVIGKKRFIYDLWGDTVNVASRMESQGVVDQIQVTEFTAKLISDDFQLTQRDDIVVKGKGAMSVFLVAGVAFGAKRP